MLPLLAIMALFLTVNADVTHLQKHFIFLQRSDTTVIAGSVLTQDTQRIAHEATISLGFSDPKSELHNWPSSGFRINSLSELLVTLAVKKLVALSILPGLDASIPSTLLPRGVPTFFNPNFPTVQLTLTMLMRHTSSLRDDTKFETFATTAPATVQDFSTFVDNFFVSTTGGTTFVVATDIWNNLRPGDVTSYNFARANIALMASIVNAAIALQPTLVTGTAKNIMGYVQEQILTPLGMSSTFVRQANGDFPLTSFPAGAGQFSNAVVVDLTTAGDVTTRTKLHPAFMADYMYLSSSVDVGRLVRATFLDKRATFLTTGAEIRSQPIDVSSVPSRTLGVLKQAFSIQYFDGARLCSQALSSSVISKCPLRTSSNVWGYVSRGAFSMVGIFCTDSVSSVNPTCTSVSLSYQNSEAAPKSFDLIYGLAGIAFQETIGDSTTSTTGTGTTKNTQLYGLWVFFGTVGIMTFVLVASYATEYVIQPAPVTAGTVPPPIPMGPEMGQQHGKY